MSELVEGGELFDHLAEIGAYSEKQAALTLTLTLTLTRTRPRTRRCR